MRQATKVRAFKWDAATRDWELVGDVTDAKNNVIDGVEYDQVINVTLDNGNRRLGYMNGGAYACCTLSCTSSIDAHAARQRTPTLRRSAFCSRTRTFRATTRTRSSTLSFATSNDASHRRSPWAVVLVAALTPSPATPAGTRALPLRPLRLRPRFVHRPPILYVRSCWLLYLVCESLPSEPCRARSFHSHRRTRAFRNRLWYSLAPPTLRSCAPRSTSSSMKRQDRPTTTAPW